MEMGTTVKIKNCTLNGNRLKWYLVRIDKSEGGEERSKPLAPQGVGLRKFAGRCRKCLGQK